MSRPRVKPRFGSARDAADRSGLSVRTIRRLIARGELGISRVGRRVLVDLVALDAKLLALQTRAILDEAAAGDGPEFVAAGPAPTPAAAAFPPEGAIFGPDGWELPI